MDEMNLTLPPELETSLIGFYSTPEPDAAFASHLELELRSRHTALQRPSLEARSPFFSNWSAIMQTLRARPGLAILLVLLALGLLTGVAYAIGKFSGFIPGFGFTSDAKVVYVLNAPAQSGKDGLTISVDNAISAPDKFWVAITQNGKIDTQLHNYSKALIKMPDGTRIDYLQSGVTDPGTDPQKLTFEFPALPTGTSMLTFHYEVSTSDGTVLWNVDIPLLLRPIKSDELIPAENVQTTLWQSETQGGLTLVLENVAAATNKTVLQVSLRFDRPGTNLNSDWNVTLAGADGTLYPLTEITSDTSDGNKKLFETLPFQSSEPLTLKLAVFPNPENLPMSVDLSPNAPAFTFDPGPNPQVGQTWQLDETVQVGEYKLHVVGAKLNSPSELVFEFAPLENLTGVMLYSYKATGASGGIPVQAGNFAAGITFKKLPGGPINIEIARIFYTAHGTWQIHWQAPIAPNGVIIGATSTPAPTPATFATPTLASSDPLLLEVQALAQKFDAPFQHGPGWVHVVSETITENKQVGQTFPPPYIKSEQWNEIDPDGYVLRSVWLDKDINGKVIQQVASIANYSINFTSGDAGFNGNSKYRVSFDMLTQDLNQAAQYKTHVSSENTKCEAALVPVRGEDGSACILVTLLDSFAQSVQNPGETEKFSGAGRRTWINLQTGQQIRTQAFWLLPDGSERINYTYQSVSVEKVNAPPQEILDILARVVLP